MNRRKFLLGTSATLAATCLGKPALGPISKGGVLRTEVAAGEVYGMSPAMMALPSSRELIAFCRKGLYDQLSLSERKAWNARPIEPIPVT